MCTWVVSICVGKRVENTKMGPFWWQMQSMKMVIARFWAQRGGMKKDKATWGSFFQRLKGRGLDGVRLIIGDKGLGMLEAIGDVFPDAKYQCCTVHFYRNVFSVIPRPKVQLVAKMLRAIHAQESKMSAREKV